MFNLYTFEVSINCFVEKCLAHHILFFVFTFTNVTLLDLVECRSDGEGGTKVVGYG